MKIAIFDTLIQATEYFNRDYAELFSRIENAETLALTVEYHTPKQRNDGKYWCPALDSADYTGITLEEYTPQSPTQESP